MSEELKLKPCPLCGGKADFWGGTGAVLAGCPKCHIHTIYCYPPEDAARLWNSRPAEDAKTARIAELEAERDRLRKALRGLMQAVDGCLTPSEALLWKKCEEAMKGSEIGQRGGKTH